MITISNCQESWKLFKWKNKNSYHVGIAKHLNKVIHHSKMVTCYKVHALKLVSKGRIAYSIIQWRAIEPIPQSILINNGHCWSRVVATHVQKEKPSELRHTLTLKKMMNFYVTLKKNPIFMTHFYMTRTNFSRRYKVWMI